MPNEPVASVPTVAIVAPADGAIVSRSFPVTGTLSGLQPESGQSVSIAVEIQSGQTLVRPRAEVSQPAWSVIVDERGNPPGGQFRIVALLLSDPARNRVALWFDEGLKNGGRYPGLRLTGDLSGATVLDRIRLQLRA